MQRRGFLKFLGMAAAAPVAIARALSKAHDPERPMYILTENAKPLSGYSYRFTYMDRNGNEVLPTDDWWGENAPAGSSEFAHQLSVQRFNERNFARKA